MLSKKVFSEGMAGLCEVFEREGTELLLKTYYAILKDLSDEDFKKAIGGILATNSYSKLPRPTEILETVKGNIEDRVQIAVMTIEKALRQYSPYESVSFSDKALNFIIDRYGGWPKLCEVTGDEWKFLRKDFEKQYKGISSLHLAHFDQIPYLPGIIENTNAAKGIELKRNVITIDFSSDNKAQIEGPGEVKRLA